MQLKLGFAYCGSFCTLNDAFEELEKLSRDYSVFTVASYNAASIDTRFGAAKDFLSRAESITSKKVITTITDAEPIGPRSMSDVFVVAPCTGSTLAKLANGITDTPVTMAVKSHLRGGKPLVIALATNDALSANLRNIGTLLSRKNVYFVPLKQDDPKNKPDSLVADFTLLPDAISLALSGEQMRPIFRI